MKNNDILYADFSMSTLYKIPKISKSNKNLSVPTTLDTIIETEEENYDDIDF